MADEITQILNNSIQERATADPNSTFPSVLFWIARGSDIVAPWWSPRRDLDLGRFWMVEDHVSGAIYNMVTKMTAVNFHVEPPDMSIKSYIRKADELTKILYENTEFFNGWNTGFGRWVTDLLTQDNGAFFEVIGPGRKDGPLTGGALGIAHLDAQRCMRTRSPEFPVIFDDVNGKRYKLHYSRVIFVSQLPSARALMNGVGFCALSRMINCAQNLIDITMYEQEMLGSRPKRQLLVGTNITSEEIMKAFYMADKQMDAQGLTRYSGTIAIGAKGTAPVGIQSVDLNSAPQSFDKEKSTTLAMFTIALALGVDARELWPASASGATKADAMLQHMKARGKGPGQIRSDISDQINQKFLPDGYKIVFDVQDDEEDAQAAEIKNTRATTRKTRLETQEINIRVAREQAFSDGDLTEAQFDELELSDGRLPDGSDVFALFYSNDPEIDTLLELGTSEPFNVSGNDQVTMLRNIDNNINIAMQRMANASSASVQKKARQAIVALQKLRTLYEGQSQQTEAQIEEEVVKQLPEEDLDEYDDEITALAIEARESGEFDGFSDRLVEISAAAATAAYLASLGISNREQLTLEQVAALDRRIQIMRESASKFESSLRNGEFDGEAGLRKMLNRISLWLNNLEGVYEMGKLYGDPGKLLMWKYNPTKEHCTDCVNLNGKIYTASKWKALGIYPKSRDLECGGWRCGCEWVETEDNETPGIMPFISGPKKKEHTHD